MLRRLHLRRLGYAILYGVLGAGVAAAVVGGIAAHPLLLYLGVLGAALAVVALALDTPVQDQATLSEMAR
jgi:hypothetical protein